MKTNISIGISVEHHPLVQKVSGCWKLIHGENRITFSFSDAPDWRFPVRDTFV